MKEKNSRSSHHCKQCAYYMPHYILSSSGKFEKLPQGHCLNDNYSLAQSSKIIKRNLPCGFWEERKIAVKERTANIIDRLLLMTQYIEEIASVLKDYND